MAEIRTHTEVADARRALDAAYACLCKVEDGALPLREVEQPIALGLERCYAALGEGGDAERFSEAVAEASRQNALALRALQDAASEDPAWAACTEAAAEALSALHAARFRAGVEPLVLPRASGGPALRASVGLPRLLDPARPILRPTLPLPAREEPDPEPPELPTELAPAEPVSPAELDALMLAAAQASAEADSDASAESEPNAGGAEQSAPVALAPELLEALRFGEQQREPAVRAARMKVALEELGMLSAMRRPDDHDAWTSNRECERRMLCRLDAIAAAGLDALPWLIKQLEDRPLPDPELNFALLFVLGSLRGDDTADQIARLLGATDLGDEDVRVACEDALAFAPHPAIPELARSWLGHATGARRALAIAVLARKGMLEPESVTRGSADAELAVVRAAARALSVVAGAVEASAVHRLLHHQDSTSVKHALFGAALCGDPRALARARELTEAGRGDHGEAAIVLALCGERETLAVLERDASIAGLCACGWFGHPALLERLLAALEHAEEPARLAAAEALHRITGAGITEAEPAPDLAAGPEAAPFLPGYREPTRPRQLALDAEAWRAYVERHRARPVQGARYRYGRPFAPAHDAWEIADAAAVRCDRERAYLELRARFGLRAPLDTSAFVIEQARAVAAIDAAVAALKPPRDPWQTRLLR